MSISPKELNEVFFALSDETRRSMLERLSKKPALVSEFVQNYGVSKAAISKHLRVLERAKLVKLSVHGLDRRSKECVLETPALERAVRWIERNRNFWEGKLKNLEEMMADLQTEGKDSK